MAADVVESRQQAVQDMSRRLWTLYGLNTRKQPMGSQHNSCARTDADNALSRLIGRYTPARPGDAPPVLPSSGSGTGLLALLTRLDCALLPGAPVASWTRAAAPAS
jgi:hypothetical protein